MERQPHRRRRPARSCLGCRRRKIKCDRGSPCAHCVAAGIQCVFRVHRDDPAVEDSAQGGSLRDPIQDTPAATPLRPNNPQIVSTNVPIAGLSDHPPRLAAVPTPASSGDRRPPLVREIPSPRRNVSDPNLGGPRQPTHGPCPQAADPTPRRPESYQDMLMSLPHLEGAPGIPEKGQTVRSGHWGGISPEVIQIAGPRLAFVSSLTRSQVHYYNGPLFGSNRTPEGRFLPRL